LVAVALIALGGPVWGAHAADLDGDGIRDAEDACPNDPEDMDGVEDADGCPDPDNDRDNIPDVDDQCPMEPETINGRDDDDGCPEAVAHAVPIYGLPASQRQISEMIFFDAGQAALSAQGVPILNEVASLMKTMGDLRLTVVGHACQRHAAKAPLDALSRRRAEVVRDYLTTQGVNSTRMSIEARGCEQPIASPGDDAQRNERVDFRILD
jgi:outer membrane protein OmpA-like peptidoglycan-associated protein